MNKQDLILKVTEKTDKSYRDVEKIVNAFMDTVKETLANGDIVQMVGFGTFETRERAAREGRNPITGESIHIKAKKAPAFRPGKAFREAVNK